MDKPTAWYDPSNGVVSTDRDCPLFTPLGQVWALYPKHEWVGLTEEDRAEILSRKWWDFEDEFDVDGFLRLAEAKLKEKNT
jgi:hypothetical protein